MEPDGPDNSYDFYTHNQTQIQDNSMFVTQPEFYLTFSSVLFCFIFYNVVQHFRNNYHRELTERLCNRREIEKKNIIYEIGSSPRVCSICLEDFTENTPLIQLNCNHMYHPDCINSWLQRQSSCPLCRCEFI